MNKIIGISLTLILLLSFSFQSIAQATSLFKDVPNNHRFIAEIDHLVQLGAIGGYQDGTYKPNGNVTRGQAAKIITIALDMPLINPPKPTFKDIPKSHNFYQHIETLVANDIISGYENGTFRPGNPVKRSHMAKILANSLDLTEESAIQFIDVPKSNSFYSYIKRLATASITTGLPDGTFNLNATVNRGQMAAFVSRSVHYIEDTTQEPNPAPDMDAFWYRQVHFGMTKDQVKAAEGKPSSEDQSQLIYDEVDMDIYMAKTTYSFTNNRLDSMHFNFDIRNVTFDESEAFFKSLVEDVYEPQFFEPSSMVDKWENHNGNELLTANWDIEGHEDLLAFLQMSTGYGRDSLNLSFTIYEY